jgi:hypothetical protein
MSHFLNQTSGACTMRIILCFSIVTAVSLSFAAQKKQDLPPGFSLKRLHQLRIACRNDMNKHCKNKKFPDNVKCKRKNISKFSQACQARINCPRQLIKQCRNSVIKEGKETWSQCNARISTKAECKEILTFVTWNRDRGLEKARERFAKHKEKQAQEKKKKSKSLLPMVF